VRAKVAAIFREIVPERAERLCDGLCDGAVANAVKSALQAGNDLSEPHAYDIGFHLSDWHAQAAFIVALHLFPERFTPSEIADGVLEFFAHAPNHVAAGAALFDMPIDLEYVAGEVKDSRRSAIQ
jgi:hypothetical protein